MESTFDIVIGWPCISKYNLMIVNVGVQNSRKTSTVKFIKELVESEPLTCMETHNNYKHVTELSSILNKHHKRFIRIIKATML